MDLDGKFVLHFEKPDDEFFYWKNVDNIKVKENRRRKRASVFIKGIEIIVPDVDYAIKVMEMFYKEKEDDG